MTFIPALASERLRTATGYKYKTRLTDAQAVETLGAEGRGIQMLGPAGTAAFLDTSRCFHYGSRFVDTTRQRIVVMLQYITPLAFILPDDHRDGARFAHLVSSQTDELTRLTLGAA